jgi:hypothetical protein
MIRDSGYESVKDVVVELLDLRYGQSKLCPYKILWGKRHKIFLFNTLGTG